ncbi:DUF6441 family protein [Sphingomonas profundi]|uniref:DUF6441 family protein n=1 Tax=Alterirhizorhabdus profundi TaxID=2681549 RepID=UPI0012E9414C|nr:DUF6441 family protein [Sphingomonas profundi]
MGFVGQFSVDLEKLRTERDRSARAVLGAGTGAIRDQTKALERRLEQATQAAVPGRLWRAWNSKAYPATGIAREPVGTLFLKGRDRTQGALAFFTIPGRIRGKTGQYLAIPTAAAGSRGRLRDLTPGEWERRNGARLRFVYRPGHRASLLVLDEGVLRGKKQIAGLNTEKRRATGRGNTTIVIFFLVPFVDHANRFSIEPIVNASEGELSQDFFARIRNLR